MAEPPAALRDDLVSLAPSEFASRWMFERIPHIFNSDLKQYVSWKHQLGTLINVDPRAITIVGSACVGTSLNPGKNFKVFDKTSDIDVAIVSVYYFDTLWRWLRTLGADYYKLSIEAKAAVDDHRSSYLYWGVIATEKLLPHTPLAGRWVPALHQMRKIKPTVNRDVKVRLYADYDALRAYHIQGIEQIRRKSLRK